MVVGNILFLQGSARAAASLKLWQNAEYMTGFIAQLSLANMVGNTCTLEGTGIFTMFKNVTTAYGVHVIRNDKTIDKQI